MTGFVLDRDQPYAVYHADWSPHTDETWLEVTIGSFDEPDYADHVTLGCRYGPVDGQDEFAASFVEPTRHGERFLGQVLDRDAALRSDRLQEFWEVTDWLVLNDELLDHRVHHLPMVPSDEEATS